MIPLCPDVNSYSAIKSIYSSIGLQEPSILKGIAHIKYDTILYGYSKLPLLKKKSNRLF